ncbi:MAG: magnesium transporter CorA family protein [Paracoccaceae bacterium]
MISAYRADNGKLSLLPKGTPLEAALWVDLYKPLPGQEDLAKSLGIEVPTLADMEEIEISNRLYREGGVDYMTVVLPGLSETKLPTSGPVTFILTPTRLITVRHHVPRPFETYPERADKVGPGCDCSERVFLGLIEEVIGRLADLLEGSGRALEDVTRSVFSSDQRVKTAASLQDALERVGRESDLVARIRLSLLTLERGVSFFGQTLGERTNGEALRPVVKGMMRDLQALEVHGDYLSSRVAQATDATLGMINLLQNTAVRIVSVVAVLFLPPTLIASIYGMNFAVMPELSQSWGYPMALGLMVASAAATYAFFKWKKWL